MVNKVKKILAIAGLAAAAVFVVSILVLMVSGYNVTIASWVYGSLAVFLVLGLTALLINYLQKRAEEAKQEKENAHTQKS